MSHALIHVAAKELGLEDEDLRDLYERATGKRSLREMSAAERADVVEEMKRLGFTPSRGGKGFKPSRKPHVRKIHAIWASLGRLGALRDPSRNALRSFVAKRADVTDPEWLTGAQAAPVIEALKAMERRAKAGADQDQGGDE